VKERKRRKFIRAYTLHLPSASLGPWERERPLRVNKPTLKRKYFCITTSPKNNYFLSK
jgi:hypothetical protein